MPLVSVIVPNYNHEKYLKQRIESVLNQTFQDFELLLLDDNSTDSSTKIVQEYTSHPKVSKVICNSINSGSTFIQWKKGIEVAQGKLIWIAESDDYAESILLETLVTKFFQYPDLILSYCQSNIVDENNNFIRIMDWADDLDHNRWKKDYVEFSSVENSKYLSYRNTLSNASAILFKKPADLTILNESCTMKMGGDWLFWRKLLSTEGKVSYSSKPLNYFRTHTNSTRAAQTKEKELDRLEEYRRLVVPELMSAFSDKYDWMVYEWYKNRSVFKGTIHYYIPDLPMPLKCRYLALIIKFFKKRLR